MAKVQLQSGSNKGSYSLRMRERGPLEICFQHENTGPFVDSVPDCVWIKKEEEEEVTS